MSIQEQEIFKRVSDHLLIQGKKSFRNALVVSSRCAYRGEDNCKCAIGILISDDVYNPNLEGYSSDSEAVKKALHDSGLSVYNLHHNFLYQLQQIHDSYDPTEWALKLKEFANLFNLSIKDEVNGTTG